MLKVISDSTWEHENCNPKTLNLLPLHCLQEDLLSNHVLIIFFCLFLEKIERCLYAFPSLFEDLLFMQTTKQVKSQLTTTTTTFQGGPGCSRCSTDGNERGLHVWHGRLFLGSSCTAKEGYIWTASYNEGWCHLKGMFTHVKTMVKYCEEGNSCSKPSLLPFVMLQQKFQHLMHPLSQ